MNIQRYSIVNSEDSPSGWDDIESNEGHFCTYDDHIAEVQRLAAEVQRLRDLLREAQPHVERSAFSFRVTEGLAERIAAECSKEKT
jgi:hypothetical protein